MREHTSVWGEPVARLICDPDELKVVANELFVTLGKWSDAGLLTVGCHEVAVKDCRVMADG